MYDVNVMLCDVAVDTCHDTWHDLSDPELGSDTPVWCSMGGWSGASAVNGAGWSTLPTGQTVIMHSHIAPMLATAFLS